MYYCERKPKNRNGGNLKIRMLTHYGQKKKQDIELTLYGNKSWAGCNIILVVDSLTCVVPSEIRSELVNVVE